jgi:DNA-binding NarL/FixJ family response regulator
VRVVVAEDLFLLRDGLARLLSAHDFEIAAAVDSAPGLLCALLEHRPDIAVVDVRLPPAFADDGLQAALAARREVPGLPVLLLSQYVEQLYARELLADQAGAVGYLLKDVSSEKLFEAIRAAARGEYFLLPSITAKVMTEFSRLSRAAPPASPTTLAEPLSPREMEILRLVATGASNRDIAETLVIAEGTVKNHLTNILGKLSVKDRMQAVLKAREYGLI